MLKKDPGHKITILTCYDYPTARAMDKSDVDIVFVGDSVGTNILGYRSELEVTMEDMIHHLKAVRKGITQKVLMVDLPYCSYQDVEMGVKNAKVLHDKGADIIKLEGGKEIAAVVDAIRAFGIDVMGHIGFQPQISRREKRVVGALAEEAIQLYEDAISLQKSGVCGIVLECVPEDVSKEITSKLTIPTIGIGSGSFTDGQVLVYSDVVGWYNMPYRFFKSYDNFYERTINASDKFVNEVSCGEYPQRNHAFRIKNEEFVKFKTAIEDK